MAGRDHDEAAGPANRGHLRASHADREQVIEAIKTAFAQGRLTKDELTTRAGQALTSRTYGELTAITASIPTGQEGSHPPNQAIPAGKPAAKKVAARAAAVVILPPALWAIFLTYYGGIIVLFLFAFLGATLAGMRSGGRHPARILSDADGGAPSAWPPRSGRRGA